MWCIPPSILCYGVQIVVMLLTHNYILTLSIQVGTNILQNIITMLIANKMYPYIKKRNNESLRQREERGDLPQYGGTGVLSYRAGDYQRDG